MGTFVVWGVGATRHEGDATERAFSVACQQQKLLVEGGRSDEDGEFPTNEARGLKGEQWAIEVEAASDDMEAASDPAVIGFVEAPEGVNLYDYETGRQLRAATAAELEASEEAAHSDGGCGVVKIDGRWCYVQ